MNRYILLIFLIIILIFILKNKHEYEYFENKKDLVVIIPVRDRDKHLKLYLKKMIPIFKKQNINYKILIVEQTNNKKFNKGKINNVGFIEAKNNFPYYDSFLFNDVDNFPINEKVIDYRIQPKGFHHFFGNKKWLGGFYITTKKFFEDVNGYSNNFWGWGGEDKDLQHRCLAKKIKIIRDVFFERGNNNKIHDIDHKRDTSNWTKKKYYDNKNRGRKYLINNKLIENDGISNCNYNILKRVELEKNVEKILVDI